MGSVLARASLLTGCIAAAAPRTGARPAFVHMEQATSAPASAINGLNKVIALDVALGFELPCPLAQFVLHRRVVASNNERFIRNGISYLTRLARGLRGANQLLLATLAYSVHLKRDRHFILL
jgi:hypothetical protein